MFRRIFGISVIALGALSIAPTALYAQAYPTKPITFLVPYGPGTGNDVIARIVAQKVADNWGKSILVENRVGAAGGIATEATAKAPPDGYTIVIAGTSQVINQYAPKARYDILKDFAPVTFSGYLPLVLAVSNSVQAKTMGELVSLAKARPAKLNYAATPGGMYHFMGEILKFAEGVDLVMVPYKSSTDAVTDVVSGRVEIMFTTMATALPLAKAGKLKILAVTTDSRVAALPDVPTMAEAGVPSLSQGASYYILAPVGTPKAIVDSLNREFVKAMNSQDVKDRLIAAGYEPKSSTPEQLADILRNDVAKWGKIVKETGIRLE